MLLYIAVGLLAAASAPRAALSSPNPPAGGGHEQLAAAAAGCTAAAADATAAVVRDAKLVCGDAAADAALRTVLLRLEESEHASRTLAQLGFQTALDLQLLVAGGPEMGELMGELKASGLSLGGRVKVRLLIHDGGPAHLSPAHLPQPPPEATTASQDSRLPANIRLPAIVHDPTPLPPPPAEVKTANQESRPPPSRRALQDTSAGSGSLSTDTIAIVLTVLVGAAGSFVQAYTARRAEQAPVEQAREHHLTELKRQQGHQQMLAQTQRTDRWLDECCRPIMQCISNELLAYADAIRWCGGQHD